MRGMRFFGRPLRLLSGGGNGAPLLSDQLRKLYLRIHPDLLPNHPEQREVNSASFAQLNAFLGSVKTGQRFQSTQFRLKFYLKADEADPDDDAKANLKLVDVPVMLSNPDPFQTKSQITSALKELFLKCELPAEFDWGDYAQTQGGKSWRSPASNKVFESSVFVLRTESKGEPNDKSLKWFFAFLRDSHLKATDLRINNTELHMRSRAMIADLRLSGFRIIIEDEHEMPISEQLDVVTSFYSTFKTHVLDDVLRKSAIFVLSKSLPTHIDQIGRICLNVEDTPSEWLEAVSKVGLQFQFAEKLAQRHANGVVDRSEFKKLKDWESSVAQSIGVYDIFAEYAILGKHAQEYYELLSRLSASKVLFQDLGQGFKGLSEITLVVSDSTEIEQNEELGVVLIPVHEQVDRIVQFLQENSDSLVHNQDTLEAKRKALDSLLLDVKRRLRIGTLQKDPVVSQDEFLHCIQGLRTLPDGVRRFFAANVNLIISDRFELVDRGISGTIRLHWDCLREANL